jgi:HlyD family secretion protein
MYVRTIVIPMLAVGGVAFALYTASQSNQPITPAKPVAEPATSDFATPVAGAGIVEASTQNIAIGTPVAGVVSKVHVTVGDKVKAGQPLFEIEDRSLRAELAVRESELMLAQSRLAREQMAPRPEDVPPVESRLIEAQAGVTEAQATLSDAQVQLANAEATKSIPGAISQEEFDRRKWTVEGAEARLKTSQARVRTAEMELARLRAGTWKPDIQIAEAQVAAAAAAVARVKTELERLVVRAPKDGQVLQVNVRTGEFAQAGTATTPLMLFGNTDVLHVRVDVDENDAWRVKAGAKARASLRGNSQMSTDAMFVRFEPYVVPKRSLTGDSSERVDTRVLQLIYSIKATDFPVYVGQQMDVFIDATPTTGGGGSSGGARAAAAGTP